MIELTDAEEEQLFYELAHIFREELEKHLDFVKRYPTLYKVYGQLFSNERKNRAIWWTPKE